MGNVRLRRFGEKEPPKEAAEGVIACRQRLGGLLKHYYRQAACREFERLPLARTLRG